MSTGRLPTKAERIISQLNATNTKRVAFVLVLGFVTYHGIRNYMYGSDSCDWLLSKGRFKGDKEWQPYGCMMHKYSSLDTRRCFRYLAFWGNKNQFVFIGDTRVRMLYQMFINHIHPNEDDNASVLLEEIKADANYEDSKLKMKAVFLYNGDVSSALFEYLAQLESDSPSPSVIVASFTHQGFLAGNVSGELLHMHTYNLSQLVEPFDKLVAKKSKVLWKLQDPVNEHKLSDNWKRVKNDDIEKFNRIAKDVFKHSLANVWGSSTHIADGLLADAVDGYKLSLPGLRHDVQIILNMYCNDYMNYNDGTCCSSAEPYTILQIVSYAVFGMCVVLAVATQIRQWVMGSRGSFFYSPLGAGDGSHIIPTSGDPSTPVMALATLGLILAYFYLCDRTNFFMKENKYYSEFSFWIPVGYWCTLGLFFTDDSRFTKVLNRDQTDELKGWILSVVLIYYMTGAHRVLPIHMHIRVLISGYLFLTGYSHFTYMWRTGNSGLVRFFQVMFRLNFMTIVLCFCMNRPYQFYYFVPLLSFWMCVIYFVLSLPPRVTAQSVENNALHHFYLVAKFVGCFSVITILFMSEVFFERIFVTRPWKALFVTTDDDIHEWWYQWKLDRYTVTFGMIFAACFHVAQKYNFIDDNNHGNLFSPKTSLIVSFMSVIGVGFYTTFSFLCRNEQDCEEIHSYIVFIPIIGFIALRNVSGVLRTRYSSFFAWFGRISLELFICQYHIWLAADRHGVLVLLPGFPTLNLIVTCFFFVCASHEVHRITQVLLPYAVPDDWKLVTRNFIIFFIVLIPIGRHDGMF